MDLTILEIHLDDARFDAGLPAPGPTEDGTEGEAPAGGPSPAAAVAALVALLALALLARRLLARDDGDVTVDVPGE